jgi:hypothetical protein
LSGTFDLIIKDIHFIHALSLTQQGKPGAQEQPGNKSTKPGLPQNQLKSREH